jgi:hypothetical protein
MKYGIKVSILFLLLFIHWSFRFQQKPSAIWQDGFEVSDWKKNWKIGDNGNWGMENTMLQRGHNTSQFLRINFPVGSLNKGKKSLAGGIHFTSTIPQSDSLYLKYYIRLGEQFPSRNAIVLPGLSIQDNNEGSLSAFNVIVGYEGKLGISFQSLIINKKMYMVSSNPYTLGKNEWYCIEQKIKLNEPGSNSGEIKLWVNEILVMEKTNLYLRSLSDQKLNAIDFSAFIANNNNKSVIEYETNIDFDSFVVSSNIVGINHPKP